MSRLEAALLMAFAAGLAASAALPRLFPPVAGTEETAERSTWRRQEQALQERMDRIFRAKRAAFEEKLERNPALGRRVQATTFWVLFAAVLSVGALFRFVWRRVRGRPTFVPLGAPAPAGWGGRQVFRVGLTALAVLQWISVGQTWLARTGTLPGPDRHILSLGNTLLLDGVVTVCVIGVFLKHGGFLRRTLFPGAGALWPAIRFSVGAYFTALPVLAFLALAVTFFVRLIGYDSPPQPVVTLVLSESRPRVLLWLMGLVAVAGPVAEELFFRGLVYGVLRRRMHWIRAVAVTALFFSALHMHAVAFLPIFGLGCLFGWVYERTGSLAAPIALHVIHNSAMMGLAWTVKSLLELGAGP